MKQQDLLNGVGTTKAKTPEKPQHQPPTQVLDGDKAGQASMNVPAAGLQAGGPKTSLIKNSDNFSGAACLQAQLADRQAVPPNPGAKTDQIMPFGERLMTIKQVSAMLGMSIRFVWRLVARGDLRRPVRLGRSCRWVYSDVLAYIEKLKGDRDRRAR